MSDQYLRALQEAPLAKLLALVHLINFITSNMSGYGVHEPGLILGVCNERYSGWDQVFEYTQGEETAAAPGITPEWAWILSRIRDALHDREYESRDFWTRYFHGLCDKCEAGGSSWRRTCKACMASQAAASKPKSDHGPHGVCDENGAGKDLWYWYKK